MSKLVSNINGIIQENHLPDIIFILVPFLFPFYMVFLGKDFLSKISLQQADQLFSDADVAEKDDLIALLVATDFRPRKYQLARLGSTLIKREATRVADEIRQRLELACK